MNILLLMIIILQILTEIMISDSHEKPKKIIISEHWVGFRDRDNAIKFFSLAIGHFSVYVIIIV